MDNKKILLIGDCCIDRFIYTNSTRFCPEAPVPVLDIVEQKENLGMAGNVYENLQSFNFDIEFIKPTNYTEHTKERIVDRSTNHMFLRIDNTVATDPINLDALQRLDYSKYDAVVISDYCKGFVTEEAITLISELHEVTFLDTKKVLGRYADRIAYIKINESESKNNQEYISTNRLRESLIVTLGSKGCLYKGDIYSTEDVVVKDVSGAGDSFLTGLVYGIVRRKMGIAEALGFANRVAGHAVRKRGVTVVRLEDVGYEDEKEAKEISC